VASLRVDSCGHQLRVVAMTGNVDRIDEIVELCLAFFVVACNAHHVLVVGRSKIGVGVYSDCRMRSA